MGQCGPKYSPVDATRAVSVTGHKVTTAEDKDAQDPLLKQIAKDPWSQARWRSILHPSRARETLAAQCRLELNLRRATSLITPPSASVVEVGGSYTSTVKVFVDDALFAETGLAVGLNPVWNSPVSIPIVTPMSMVRLQIVCSNGKDMAFVEFCVGDLPYNKEIKGAMELRKMDKLAGTSSERYKRHCNGRDDHDTAGSSPRSRDREPTNSPEHTDVEEGKHEGAESKGSSKAASLEDISKSISSTFNADHIYKKAKKSAKLKPKSLALCCQAPPHEETSHAGEVHVDLHLKTEGKPIDQRLAYALRPHPPKVFGVMVEGYSLDAQLLLDNVMTLKTVTVDDALAYVMNYMMYILEWRCFTLSFLLTAVFSYTCYETWLFPCTFPGVVGVMLALNGIRPVREAMTVAGSNAKLGQEGMNTVAAMRSTKQMKIFIQRAITKFEGVVTDHVRLESVAARCFHDGVPVIKYDELVEKLRKEEWITLKPNTIKTGDLVYVDGRDCGTCVSGGEKDGQVMVELERTKAIKAYPKEKVTIRFKVPYLLTQTDYLPAQLTTSLIDLHLQISKAGVKLTPLLTKLTVFFTWDKWLQPFLVTTVLLSISIGGGILVWKKDGGPTGKGPPPSPLVIMIAWIVANLDNATVLFIGLAVLLSKARWLLSVKSIFAILGSCCHRRRAPKNWKFFREESAE